MNMKLITFSVICIVFLSFSFAPDNVNNVISGVTGAIYIGCVVVWSLGRIFKLDDEDIYHDGFVSLDDTPPSFVMDDKLLQSTEPVAKIDEHC